LTSGIANPADSLEITLEDSEEISVLGLKGRLGIDSSPDLRDRLLAMFKGPSLKSVVVDLAELTYVDTSGIATLLEGLKIARNRQRTLSLKGLQGRLLHLFEVTGVLPFFGSDRGKSSSSEMKVS